MVRGVISSNLNNIGGKSSLNDRGDLAPPTALQADHPDASRPVELGAPPEPGERHGIGVSEGFNLEGYLTMLWQDEVWINYPNVAQNQPDVAVDGEQVYVVWRNFTGNYDIAFMRHNETAWEPPVRIADASVSLDHPRVTAYNGNVYVCYENRSGSEYYVQMIRSADNGSSWQSPVTVAKTPGDNLRLPEIEADPTNGTVWMVWQHQNGTTKVEARNWTLSAGFGATFEVTQEGTEPDVTVYNHSVWFTYENGSDVRVKRYNGTLSAEMTPGASLGGTHVNPTIATSALGATLYVYVAYEHNGLIYLSKYNQTQGGGSLGVWESPVWVNNGSGVCYDPSIASFEGHAVTCWTYVFAGDYHVRTRHYDGDSFEWSDQFANGVTGEGHNPRTSANWGTNGTRSHSIVWQNLAFGGIKGARGFWENGAPNNLVDQGDQHFPGKQFNNVSINLTDSNPAYYKFWINGTLNATGSWVSGANISRRIPFANGTYQVQFFVNDTFGLETWSRLATVTVGDLNPPSIAGVDTPFPHVYSYGQVFNGSLKWLDAESHVDKTWFVWNGDTIWGEYWTGGWYNYTFTDPTAGSYTVNVWANDTNGWLTEGGGDVAWITRADIGVNLTLAGVQGNRSVDIGDSVTFEATRAAPGGHGGQVQIYYDGVLLAQDSTDTVSIVYEPPDGEAHNVTGYFIGVNYTGRATWWLNVVTGPGKWHPDHPVRVSEPPGRKPHEPPEEPPPYEPTFWDENGYYVVFSAIAGGSWAALALAFKQPGFKVGAAVFGVVFCLWLVPVAFGVEPWVLDQVVSLIETAQSYFVFY